MKNEHLTKQFEVLMAQAKTDVGFQRLIKAKCRDWFERGYILAHSEIVAIHTENTENMALRTQELIAENTRLREELDSYILAVKRKTAQLRAQQRENRNGETRIGHNSWSRK